MSSPRIGQAYKKKRIAALGASLEHWMRHKNETERRRQDLLRGHIKIYDCDPELSACECAIELCNRMVTRLERELAAELGTSGNFAIERDNNGI